MNEKMLQERIKRILQVNECIKQLDPSVRSAAFSLLQDYITGHAPPAPDAEITKETNSGPIDNAEAFFAKFSHEKPSDNALLVSAYHFGQYGSASFTVEEIKSMSDAVGVTVPERLDMTLQQCSRDGKSLFLRAGKGAFRPTVHGEAFFKKTYQVSKGTHQKRSTPEDE